MKDFTSLFISLTLIISCSITSFGQCSTEIPIPLDNSGLENWASEGSYEDPTGDFWDTTNKIVDINPLSNEPNVLKVTDAHSGNYAAKLTTTTAGLLTAATLFSGTFNPNPANPLESVEFGKPFTETPDYFRVWYKYEPIQGDSAEIYCYLEKGANNETRIATAYTKVYDAQSEWTELVLPFDYESSEAPESITIVFASSARGDIFQGQVGNTLYIDDIELFKCSTPTENVSNNKFSATVFPNPSSEDEDIQFKFNQEREVVLSIFSFDGRSILSKEINNSDNYSLDVSNWNNGLYQYTIQDESSNEVLHLGTFVIQ